MKTQTKLTALALVLLMVLGCLFACGKGSGKVKTESVTDRANELKYKTLKSNSDKLFWSPENEHPAAGEVANFGVDGGQFRNFLESLGGEAKGFEGGIELSVDKMTAQGKDVLEQLGGPLKATGKLLTDGKLLNGDLAVAAGGMNVSVKLAADGSGVVVESPFMLTKPIFIPIEKAALALEKAAENGELSGGINIGDVKEIGSSDEFSKAFSLLKDVFEHDGELKEWKDEKLTKQNIDHIRKLVKDCVPEEAITVTKVTPPELKGEFITFDTETECVELKLTGKTGPKLLSDLVNAISEDAVVKDVVVSFIETLGEAFNGNIAGEAGENIGSLYDKLMKELRRSADTMLSESKSAAGDGNDDNLLTVRRYFAGGRSVKTEIIALEEDSTDEALSLCCWNIYANTNANEFGVKISADGNEYVNFVGGRNETDAKLDGTVTFQDKDDDKSSGTLKVKYVGKDGSVQAKADFNLKDGADGSDVKAELTYEGDEDVQKLKFSASDDKSSLDLTYDGESDDRALKVSFKNEEDEFSLDYSKEADDETFTADLKTDETAFSLNGTKKAQGDSDLYAGEFSVNQDGDMQTVGFECEHQKTQNGEKTEHNYKIKLNAGETAEIEATLVVSVDKASKNVPTAPAKDEAVELTDDMTEDDLLALLSPQFAKIVEGLIGGSITDNDESGESYEEPSYSDEPSGTYNLIRVRFDGEETDLETLSAAELEDSYITFDDDGSGEIFMQDGMEQPLPFYWEDNNLSAEQGGEAIMNYELDGDIVTVFIFEDGEAVELDFRLN